MAGRIGGCDGDLLCFVMRENFLIIFIQIFLINSLIFLDEQKERAEGRGDGDGNECNEIILLNGKISIQ